MVHHLVAAEAAGGPRTWTVGEEHRRTPLVNHSRHAADDTAAAVAEAGRVRFHTLHRAPFVAAMGILMPLALCQTRSGPPRVGLQLAVSLPPTWLHPDHWQSEENSGQ